MIVPASPIIPSYDDGSVCPILAAPNRVDNGGYPRGSSARADAGMIGRVAIGHYPAYLRELPIGYVLQDLRRRDNHVLDPIRSGASELAVNGLRLADVLNCVGRGPNKTNRVNVVVPGHTLRIEEVGQCGMLKAGIYGRHIGFAPGGIDQQNSFRQGSDAPCGRSVGIFRGEKVAGRGGG